MRRSSRELDGAFARLEVAWRALRTWHASRSFAFVVVACTVIFGIGGVLSSSWEWAHVRGHAVEHAEVIGWERADGVAKCGKYAVGEVYELIWRSQNPPAGMPATFTSLSDCTHHRVGEEIDVVRSLNADGSFHVWEDPGTGFGYVALTAGGLAAFGLFTGLFAAMVRLGWRWLRSRPAPHLRA